jgi:hypothetical protein
MDSPLVLTSHGAADAYPLPTAAVSTVAASQGRRRASLTHMINPFATSSSDHARAQAITFAALRNAVDEARRHGIDVELLAGVFEEDASVVEAPARILPPLGRSIADVVPLEQPRRLPLIADLLNLAYEHGRGEYLIFTNMDISPQRDFYRVVQRLLPRSPHRPRALVINRRTIPAHFAGPEQLEAMYRERGVPHEGYDCFVFPRAWVPELVLGDCPVGGAGFDQVLVANFEVLSGFRTDILFHQRLTFHLGDDKAWARESELCRFNDREASRILRLLRERCPRVPVRGPFVYVHHVVTKEPPPPASLVTRAWWRLKRELKERLYSLRIKYIRTVG